MKKFPGKTTLVITFILLLISLSSFAQKTGKRLQFFAIGSLTATVLYNQTGSEKRKTDIPSYVPFIGVGIFGVGMTIELRGKKKKK